MVLVSARSHRPAPELETVAGKDDVLHERAARGLCRYTAQIATAVGAGAEAAWCEWADAPCAYIALDHKPPTYPDRDTALIWTAERGWEVALETGCGEDLLVTASLGGDVLATPAAVADFARAVLGGRETEARKRPIVAVPADLPRRLAVWADRSDFRDRDE